ncbi:MAG: chemotaxis protein CheB [Syntrophobacteraceae bacterium]|nr:chemotaxis protein CheB [Desulfobacteraceae bacterium]
MTGRDIIVMGASAGGVQAYIEIVAGLPRDLEAAVFLVLHMLPNGRNELPKILSREGRLPAGFAVDGDPIEHGRIYVAPPDLHMILKQDSVRLIRGPHENRTRPAIDPLFRSAAQFHGGRAVGVILTGMLDDGTAGLRLLKSCGGIAIVQDPADADYPSMPGSARSQVDVDYVLPLKDIAAALVRLVRQGKSREKEFGKAMEKGPDILERFMFEPPADRELGKFSGLVCPECGGPVMENSEGGHILLRCRTGHAFSLAHFDEAQAASLEAALWNAVRVLEECRELSEKLAEDMIKRGNPHTAQYFKERATKTNEHARIIRRMLSKKEA